MQGPSIRIAKQLGLESCVVDGDPRAPCAGHAARFDVIDLRDEAGILAHAEKLRAEGGLSAVFTAGTDFSPAVARVAEEFGLPGIPLAVARRAQDKGIMRAALREASVPCPRFTVVSGAEGLREAARDVPGPWVVKPVDSMGSRGCMRVDAAEGLERAVRDALGFSRSLRAVVEEYLEGPEFSVDALVWEGRVIVCGVADRDIRFPPYFIEMGHTMPSARGADEIREVLRVFELGVRAIGISQGAAKGDIKLCPDGRARVGEIAARLSGGYMSGWTFPYSSGVEATAGALRIAMGRAPGDMEPRYVRVSAERAFISIPGRVKEIAGLEEARSVPGVRDIFLRAEAGAVVVFPRNNVEKCGNVIAVADERGQASRAAETACAAIRIRLEPLVPETESFLDLEGDFPPQAFSGFEERLNASIEALPERAPGQGQGVGIIDVDIPRGHAIRDWSGMDIGMARDAALRLSGASIGSGRILLGREFWKALIRGGYQGGAYAIDRARLGLEREGEGGR
jgi:biotin carboxylase